MDGFYSTPVWRNVRDAALARDAHRCTVSRLLGGACSGLLHVHHIEPLKYRRDLSTDLDNLGTACATHHAQWDALARALRKTRMTNELDREARKAAAVAESEAVARAWSADSSALYDRLDDIERSHRVSLGYLEHERIVSLSPAYQRTRRIRERNAVARLRPA